MEDLSPPSPSSDGGQGVLQGRYELGRVLGQGTFAKVYLARNLRTGKNVAIKVVRKEKIIQIGMTEHVKREISVMKKVTHPNIVELHEVMASRSKIYFAMELVRGGELFSKIVRSGRLREDAARHYFRQLISAVDFCHSRGVYHRDLKPENLLLDNAGHLKVADFGLSALADHARTDGLLHTTCGTPAYAAPEVMMKKGYDGSKADLWSCGVILFVLLAGFLPFQHENIVGMYGKIRRGDFRCPPWFSSDARRLIARLLDPNLKTRITVSKLVESPWFRKTPLPKPFPVKKEGDHEPVQLTAFDLISLSEGLDLSPLFEIGGSRESGLRFVTKETARGVISRIEGLVARVPGRLRVTDSSPAGVRFEGEEQRGGEARLAVAAEIFALAPSVLVVEVRKDGGDSIEYRRFCRDELRPAIEDIILASPDAPPKPTSA